MRLFLLAVVIAAGFGGWFFLNRTSPQPVEEPQEEEVAREVVDQEVEVPEQHPSIKTEDVTPKVVNWNQVNDEGIRLLSEDDLEGAIEAFERCVAGDPDEPVFVANLAEALARSAVRLHEEGSAGARLAAIARLERATTLDASREKLRELLGRWKRSEAAEEGFFVHPTEHFDFSYDLDRSEVDSDIDALAKDLEDAYMSFAEAFAIWPVEEGRPKIRVVIYTREGFDQVTEIGPWAGGVYDGTIRVPVANLAAELGRVRSVLRHELVHAFIQEKGGSAVPAWLNEGLAQWLESDRPAFRQSAMERARQQLKGKDLFALETIAGSLVTWEDREAIQRAYSQALALVGWIGMQYQSGEVQSVGVLFEMVAGCAEGVPAEVTFKNRIGLDLSVVIEDMMEGL